MGHYYYFNAPKMPQIFENCNSSTWKKHKYNTFSRNILERLGECARISLSPQRYDSQPAAIAAGCFRHTADASSLVADVWRKQPGGPSGPTAVGHSFARTPREGAEMPQAQRRGISPFPQTAAHRHPLWATRTPIPMRQGPILGYGAPQSPTQRTELASPCGSLAVVRKTSRNWRFSFAELDGKNHICGNEISFNQSLSKL